MSFDLVSLVVSAGILINISFRSISLLLHCSKHSYSIILKLGIHLFIKISCRSQLYQKYRSKWIWKPQRGSKEKIFMHCTTDRRFARHYSNRICLVDDMLISQPNGLILDFQRYSSKRSDNKKAEPLLTLPYGINSSDSCQFKAHPPASGQWDTTNRRRRYVGL